MADVVDPAGANISVPADRDDDVILATLVVAKADWLVTGDLALLALRQIPDHHASRIRCAPFSLSR